MAFMVMLPAITFCVLEAQPKPQPFAIPVAAENLGHALNSLFDDTLWVFSLKNRTYSPLFNATGIPCVPIKFFIF